MSHGMPSLMLDPYPPLFGNVTDNPYDNPANPPLMPNETTGFCGMRWHETSVDPSTGLRNYHLANFSSEADVTAAGFNVTHKGHCGACSSLQDLGVYLSQVIITAELNYFVSLSFYIMFLTRHLDKIITGGL